MRCMSQYGEPSRVMVVLSFHNRAKCSPHAIDELTQGPRRLDGPWLLACACEHGMSYIGFENAAFGHPLLSDRSASLWATGMLLSLITHAQQLCFVRACSRDMWLNAAQVALSCMQTTLTISRQIPSVGETTQVM